MIAILGAGSHGRAVATTLGEHSRLFYDDNLPGHNPISQAINRYVIGAAFPNVRRQIAAKVAHLDLHHGGLVRFPGVRVGNEVRMGDHVHLLYNAVISHGCELGSFVTICAGAVLSGEVIVEDDVFIGANATVIHGGLRIGKGAVVGAGAVVIGDVDAGSTVVGNPAHKANRWGEP